MEYGDKVMMIHQRAIPLSGSIFNEGWKCASKLGTSRRGNGDALPSVTEILSQRSSRVSCSSLENPRILDHWQIVIIFQCFLFLRVDNTEREILFSIYYYREPHDFERCFRKRGIFFQVSFPLENIFREMSMARCDNYSKVTFPLLTNPWTGTA